MDERRVNKLMLKVWLKENGPSIKEAVKDLAEKSKVSQATINNVKSGYVPRKDITRFLLSDAIGVAEDVLFPFVSAKGRQKAS